MDLASMPFVLPPTASARKAGWLPVWTSMARSTSSDEPGRLDLSVAELRALENGAGQPEELVPPRIHGLDDAGLHAVAQGSAHRRRSQSPIRLIPSVAARMATPGKVAIHQEVVR